MNEPLPRLLREGPIGFTAAEFLRMGEAGLFDDMKVELIAGEIQRMNPPMNEHADRQASVIGLLWAALSGAGGRLRGEVAIDLGKETIVGSDVALLLEPIVGRRTLRPEEVLLAVEIAEATADRDLGLKRRLYAQAGIERYWVIDGPRRVTHVHARPEDGTYRDVQVVPFGQPLPVPGSDATITL